jgi:alkanesulfonate monooxygenase SsuD/methylene tetrahydromethanopterin reductase-like flavin-dependent oxidoreductase (luciferase family)
MLDGTDTEYPTGCKDEDLKMEIGIAYPKIIPATRGERVMEWAIRVDEGPFSSLAMIDRLVYSTHESMIVLAAAAAVTERVRLMPTVLVATLRPAALIAKQAASIDSISGGRLVLGMGVGSRSDDFAAVGVSMRTRGKLFDEQVSTIRKLWAGERMSDEIGPIGPRPARSTGPEILIGGRSQAALARAGRLGDGYIAGSAGSGTMNEVNEVAGYYAVVENAWKDAGKPGKPRFVAALTCAVGAYAAERTRESMRSYYAFRGEAAAKMDLPIPHTRQDILDAIDTFESVGVDELILEPGVADLDQIDQLAEIIESR